MTTRPRDGPIPSRNLNSQRLEVLVTTATITRFPASLRTIAAPIQKKVDRRDIERRSGNDRRDHEMTADQVNARLATSFQTR
jgi:hypothetical protein